MRTVETTRHNLKATLDQINAESGGTYNMAELEAVGELLDAIKDCYEVEEMHEEETEERMEHFERERGYEKHDPRMREPREMRGEKP